MTMKEQLNRLVGITNAEIRDSITREIVGNNPLLSDLYANYQIGGGWILQALERENVERAMSGNPRMYRLKVVCDKWGDPVYEGDTVTEAWEKSKQKPDGTFALNEELESDRIDGTYEQKWIRKFEFTVDAAGCITVPFSMATKLITMYGVHWISGARLSRTLKRESYEPVDDGNGNKRTVIYWRYAEVPEEEYQRLLTAGAGKAPTVKKIAVVKDTDETETDEAPVAKPKRSRRKKNDTSQGQ